MSDGHAWFKSSYSNDQGGACVEVAAYPSTIHVRDSKDKAGPQLAFSPEAWREFVAFAARSTGGDGRAAS